jgi:putative addiction module component (TIGR02574 family)
MDFTPTLDSVRGWPVDVQLDFVFQVWDQLIDEGWRPVPDAELSDELDRRLDSYQANPSKTLSWEEVKNSLRQPQ